MKSKHIFKTYEILYKLLIPIIIFLFIGSLESKADSDAYKQLNLFGEVYERVKKEYVEEVTDKELIEFAINGMLQSLDPHSSFMNSETFDEMKIQTKGEFGGLGIEVTMENGLVKVVSPIDDTPAEKAGVMSGDYISHIDKEPVLGLSLSDAVDKMRGPVNTTIEVTIIRKGEETFDLTITRDIIKIRSVKSNTEGDVGYLRITSFTQKTNKNLVKEYSNIRKKIGDKMKGLVLDLRNNPGGLLDQAVAVSDAFLNRGEIVSTRGRDSSSEQRFSATKGDITNGMPIVVLINGGSASASEIVAGALQDHKRAIIMGTQTFGKGSVQTIIPVANDGAIRLTTARYYTPSGRSIQAKGIDPDIFVSQAKINFTEDTEDIERRKESDLRGHLDNSIQENIMDKTEIDSDETKEKEEKKDYQLDRAIDLIRSISIYNTTKAS